MPPGTDPVAVAFSTLAKRLADNPSVAQDLPLLRASLEEIHKVATEPTEVMYEEVLSAGGRPALWIIPISARDSPNVILYFHGGGFVTNSVASHRKMVGHLAKSAGCKALSVEYRLAPEHRFPAQIEDGVAAYQWLLEQGYKPSSIATSGDSAGGNLATSVVLKLRELHEPLPAAIVGLSPWYDMEIDSGTMNSNHDTDAFVHKDTLGLMRALFLPENHDTRDPLANPLYADLKGLPPMYLAAGGYETLLGDSTRFAEKARKAGVSVELEVQERMQHVYPFMAGNHEQADQTIRNMGEWLKGKMGK